MPYDVPIDQAKKDYPEYEFVAKLTPSEQKAAFHVRQSGEDLCLKIIAPSYELDRLTREVQALQILNHPNVVRLREYTNSSKNGVQRHYMVEDFVPGSDLSLKLRPGNRWARGDVAKMFAAAAEGLAAMHAKDIVHRDLKPGNIRVRPDGTPVIIDFGLARHLSLKDLTKTSEGAAIGTPRYFAPEQADPNSNKHNIDRRTDLFALGVMMYEALTGRHPFDKPGMTLSQLRDTICKSDDYLNAPEFTSLPAEWRTVVTRLLEKDRVKRPHTASQVVTILGKIRGI
jgi:serine/threonine-protein kinase